MNGQINGTEPSTTLQTLQQLYPHHLQYLFERLTLNQICHSHHFQIRWDECHGTYHSVCLGEFHPAHENLFQSIDAPSFARTSAPGQNTEKSRTITTKITITTLLWQQQRYETIDVFDISTKSKRGRKKVLKNSTLSEPWASSKRKQEVASNKMMNISAWQHQQQQYQQQQQQPQKQ